MYHIYNDDSNVFASKGGSQFNPNRFNSVTMYERHYENFAYLNFVATNSSATWQEKRQAEKEIEIAKKKMSYWSKFAEKQSRGEEIKGVTEAINNKWKGKQNVA